MKSPENSFGWADRLVAFLIGWVCLRPRSVLLIFVVACIFSIAAAISQLRVNTDSSGMLNAELPFQQRSLALNQAFPILKNAIVILVRSDIEEAADETVAALAAKLGQEKTVVDSVFAPSVHPFFKENGLLYLKEDELEANLSQLNKSASFLASLRAEPTIETFFRALNTAEVLGDKAEFDVSFLDRFYSSVSLTIEAQMAGKSKPLSWGMVSDARGEVEEGSAEDAGARTQRLLYVVPVLDFSAVQPVKGAVQAINSAVDGLKPDLQALVEVGVTGDPVLRFEELRSVSSGIGLSLGVSFVLVAILLLVAYRSFARVLVTLAALVVALVLATGFAAVAFDALNLVSVAFIVLLVGLGLDFTIHAILHINAARPGTDGLMQSVTGMGRTIGGALLLSAVTTAIAFLSFSPTDFVGIAQLGVLGAAGVLIAFLVSITFVPAMVCIFPGLARSSKNAAVADSGEPLPDRSPLRHLVWLIPIAAVGAAIVGGSVRFDADPLALRDPDSQSMLSLGWLQDDPDTAPYRLSVVVPNEEQAVEAASQFKKLDEVYEAVTLRDFIPEGQNEKFELIDLAYPTLLTVVEGEGLELVDDEAGLTPAASLAKRLKSLTERADAQKLAQVLEQYGQADEDVKEAIAKDILRFFPSVIDTIKSQLKIDNVTAETLPDALTSRYVSSEGTWRVDIVPKLDIRDPANLEAFVSAVEGVRQDIAGPPVQIFKAGHTVSVAIVQAVVIAALLTLLISGLLLRDAGLVMAIFLPLCAAAAFTAAASVLLDIPFNYANVIVLPLIIGLGVDSGIHIALRRRMVASTAAFYQTSTPRAVLFSGLTTIAAFATLGLSEHRGTASMGQMLAIAIALTLASTLLLTPALCDVFARRSKTKEV